MPPCPPPPATVRGVLTADDVATYANVHSDRWPGGEIRGQLDDDRGHGND